MTHIINLPGGWRKKGMVTFTRQEIGQLMSVYGEKVSKGEWRDYALDCLPDMAVFSIFKNSQEHPIYSVAKHGAPDPRKPSKFIVYDATRMVKQSRSLLEVLQVFKEKKK